MNFNAFNRAAQTTGRKIDHFSDNIDSQLAQAQDRHTQRLEALRQQFDAETTLINQGLGHTINGVPPTPRRPTPTVRNASTKPRWAPNLWHIAGLVLLAYLMAQLATMTEHRGHAPNPSPEGSPLQLNAD